MSTKRGPGFTFSFPGGIAPLPPCQLGHCRQVCVSTTYMRQGCRRSGRALMILVLSKWRQGCSANKKGVGAHPKI